MATPIKSLFKDGNQFITAIGGVSAAYELLKLYNHTIAVPRRDLDIVYKQKSYLAQKSHPVFYWYAIVRDLKNAHELTEEAWKRSYGVDKVVNVGAPLGSIKNIKSAAKALKV